MRPRPTTKSKHNRMLALTKKGLGGEGWARRRMHICTATTVYCYMYHGTCSFFSPSTFDKPRSPGRTMWWCIFATPAMRLAPPMMQLRQADALCTGLAAGRAAPMMAVAVEQHGHSAAYTVPHLLPGLPGLPGLLHASARRHLRYRHCAAKGACHCLWPPRSNR